MKNFKYILLLLIFGITGMYSCDEEDNSGVYDIGEGKNLVVFEDYKLNLVAPTKGEKEYTKEIKMKVTGPALQELTGDVTITVGADSLPDDAAVEGTHFRIETPTITLSKSNDYFGIIQITMITKDNTPPMEGTPEFDEYVAPVMYLKIASITGDASVVASDKEAPFTLNFVPPNPYEGDYSVHRIYFHPTAGGTYPDVPYSEVDEVKTLVGITATKCETGFAGWGENLCWIKINIDNSIEFEVADTWSYDVALGDPYDPSKVSYYDRDTGVIYLYYHYYGTGGPRIFWEVFTPNF